ncbi:MAG: biopolymer transporter ExbD [Burkholderiales bacterium]|nr:biopolymer transporter ExbD [Burkholderiales bacterium]
MDEDIDSINVVPLVDVMLVLLTIVLTTATFVVTGRIPVDLAQAAQAASTQPAPVVLTLTSHKVLYLNDVRVDDLAPALARFERAQPVTVRADGALALTDFVDLVDRVKALGFEKVALEVRRT